MSKLWYIYCGKYLLIFRIYICWDTTQKSGVFNAVSPQGKKKKIQREGCSYQFYKCLGNHKTFMLIVTLKCTPFSFLLWSWCWGTSVYAGFSSRPIFNPILIKLFACKCVQTISPGEWISANWCMHAGVLRALLGKWN